MCLFVFLSPIAKCNNCIPTSLSRFYGFLLKKKRSGERVSHLLNHVNICADFWSKMSVWITSGGMFILTA